MNKHVINTNIYILEAINNTHHNLEHHGFIYFYNITRARTWVFLACNDFLIVFTFSIANDVPIIFWTFYQNILLCIIFGKDIYLTWNFRTFLLLLGSIIISFSKFWSGNWYWYLFNKSLRGTLVDTIHLCEVCGINFSHWILNISGSEMEFYKKQNQLISNVNTLYLEILWLIIWEWHFLDKSKNLLSFFYCRRYGNFHIMLIFNLMNQNGDGLLLCEFFHVKALFIIIVYQSFYLSVVTLLSHDPEQLYDSEPTLSLSCNKIYSTWVFIFCRVVLSVFFNVIYGTGAFDFCTASISVF